MWKLMVTLATITVGITLLAGVGSGVAAADRGTTISLLPSTQSATAGVPVTMSITVSPSSANGTVTFTDSLGEASSVSGSVVNGSASVPITFHVTGAHLIQANFSGTGYFDSQSNHVAIQVSPASTTTTVAGPSSATRGQSVTLTATVDPAPGTGTVQFQDGGTSIGNPVAVTTDTATLSWAFTSTGGHQITAVYSGGGGFGDSTSAPATVTVTAPSSGSAGSLQSLFDS